jgi:4-oxalocrotonate tautomerase
MPLLNIKISAPASQATTQQVASLLTDLTHQHLKKRRELTAIQVEYVPAHEWFIGGESLAATQRHSFSLNIKVTEGTNSKDEKSNYVAAVFAAIQSILGELAPASYVVIQEVRADSWGYAGRTQEFRYINGLQNPQPTSTAHGL